MTHYLSCGHAVRPGDKIVSVRYRGPDDWDWDMEEYVKTMVYASICEKCLPRYKEDLEAVVTNLDTA